MMAAGKAQGVCLIEKNIPVGEPPVEEKERV
jgi:hypothetical protein